MLADREGARECLAAGSLLRIFIGWDPREDIAFRVLCHSIWARTSVPVSIAPLVLDQLPLARPRDPYQSTDFSFSRFLVPWLCDYQGKALFIDCDMLCLGDVGEMKGEGQVSVVKLDYQPESETKFLGERQTRYPMKCWSSLMLFDCAKCKILTPEYVDKAKGLNLHQFTWADEIGEISPGWNFIPGSAGEPKMIHYTEGGPWFEGYGSTPWAEEWREEHRDLVAAVCPS